MKHCVVETAANAASWTNRRHEGHTIFQPNHVTKAGIQPGSEVNSHLAAAPLSDHHRIPPRQHVHEETQQEANITTCLGGEDFSCHSLPKEPNTSVGI